MIRYRLFQLQKSGGLWASSELFEAREVTSEVRRAVLAGFLQGEPRWAEDERGAFLYGLDAKGHGMNAYDVESLLLHAAIVRGMRA